MESGIDLIASAGTLNALGVNHHRAVKIGIGETKVVGSYKVMAIKTKHDCADPVGFLIHQKEMGLMLFATDTYYLENTFEGLNNVFIECNYAKDILYKNAELGIIDNNLKNRTIRSHFELENVKSFLKANDLSGVKNIVLLHLSDKNSDEVRFKKEIEELTGKNVIIADKGVEVDLNLFPF